MMLVGATRFRWKESKGWFYGDFMAWKSQLQLAETCHIRHVSTRVLISPEEKKARDGETFMNLIILRFGWEYKVRKRSWKYFRYVNRWSSLYIKHRTSIYIYINIYMGCQILPYPKWVRIQQELKSPINCWRLRQSLHDFEGKKR